MVKQRNKTQMKEQENSIEEEINGMQLSKLSEEEIETNGGGLLHDDIYPYNGGVHGQFYGTGHSSRSECGIHSNTSHEYLLCIYDDFFRAVGQSQDRCALAVMASVLEHPSYGCAALQHNEFWGQNFCQGLNVTANTTCSFAICTGEEFLMDQGIDLSPGACGSIT
uniref:Uncharacterized protein n=1 Tax=Molossus molossus TaxID=27622 RepID=A0A7J8JWQ7_MOLMO|nr:hypothetical protein HJG59_007848 [Molossus molossus]